jgi:hypothetical protein
MAKAELEYAVKSAERCGDKRDGELYVRVNTHVGGSRYRAWLCDGTGVTEFRGETGGYTKDVKEILKRMVRAPQDPPLIVVRTAKLLHDHFKAYLQYPKLLDDDFVGTAVEYEDAESPYRSFELFMELRTVQVDVMEYTVVDGVEDLGLARPGWLVTMTSEYCGYDGYDGEGRHTVKRKVLFKERIDPEVVWAELMRTIRYAVNALPSE